MPSVPPPCAPSTSGAAVEASSNPLTPISADPAPDRPEPTARFDLPDLCAALAVFGAVLACQLLAIVLALARQPGWAGFYDVFWPVALIVLWIGIGSCALLCRLRPRLQRLSVRAGNAAAFLLVMLVVLAVSEAAVLLGRALEADPVVTGNWLPGDHLGFLSRNLAIAAIATGLLLRYWYVSQQWRQNVRQHAELRFDDLQARIRPHFLFNSLNSIADLVHRDPAAAEEAVEDLADLLRASLREGRGLIRLDEELEITRTYERLERNRLGQRLTVEWRLAADLPMDAVIPGLTIQPLLENAIQHGIAPFMEAGTVRVTGRRDGALVRISLNNPMPVVAVSNPQPGHRLAIRNVRERLALAFGGGATLDVAAGTGEYTVTVSFPARPAGAGA